MNQILNLENGVTKKSLTEFARDFKKSDTPLKVFLTAKALEIIIKDILADDKFRKEVKEDFLIEAGGAYGKTNLYGIEIKTVSQIKKNELAKEYEYSKEIIKLKNKYEIKKLELKNLFDLIKGKMLMEINNGTAKEISVENICNEVAESDPLNDFNLNVTFK